MADVTINQLTPGTPSNAAVVPYSEGGITKSTTVSNFGVPIGAVFHLATSTVPAGYLKCNGDVVPNGSGTVQGITTNFSSLYALLGATYGSLGKLPDLRGEFVRGLDDGRGIDVSRVMGSSQVDGIKTHKHKQLTSSASQVTAASNLDSLQGTAFDFQEKDFSGGGGTQLTTGSNFTSKGNLTGYAADNEGPFVTIGENTNAISETRPRNVALMPVIKY
jgi:microcystin-dependent protein